MLLRIFALAFMFSSTLIYASDKDKQEQVETLRNIEFCRIIASQFEPNEQSKWESLKQSYFDVRRGAPAKSTQWAEPKKIMWGGIKSAENDANRRLNSLPAEELYVHFTCYEKLEKIQKSKPW